MFTKKGWFIIFIILGLSIGDFILVLNKNINVDCLFIFIQNMVFPIFITPMFVEWIKFPITLGKNLKRLLTGALVGGLPTAAMILSSNIDYFLFGGRQQLETSRGVKTPINNQLLLFDLWGDIFIFVCLISFSAISGLCSSSYFGKKEEKA